MIQQQQHNSPPGQSVQPMIQQQQQPALLPPYLFAQPQLQTGLANSPAAACPGSIPIACVPPLGHFGSMWPGEHHMMSRIAAWAEVAYKTMFLDWDAKCIC